MVDGFLVIDKPAGITSHDVVSRVRRILKTRKIGHTGTLDPFATGVLPVAVGEGTKAIPFLDEAEKGYDAVIQLGTVTDTLDCTGAVLQQNDCSQVTEEKLKRAMVLLTGQISQIPPMYSAIKQGGQALYKLARKGIEVERRPREVTIHSFDLLSFSIPFVTVRVCCSRGTYIRTLADDLGRLLGVGGSLSELRRIGSGMFLLGNALTLDSLDFAVSDGQIERHLINPREALKHLPEIILNCDQARSVSNGRPPDVDGFEGLCRLTCDGRLVAVAERLAGALPGLRRVFHWNI